MNTRAGTCWVGLATAVLAAGILAGCGTARPTARHSTAGLAPGDAMKTATRSLLAGRDLTVTVRLDTTPAALVALSTKPDQTPLTAETAKAISDGSISYSIHVPAGHSIATEGVSSSSLGDAGDAQRFLLHAGNGAEAELRSVDGALFGRAEVSRLADLTHTSFADRAELAAAAAGVGVPAPYRTAVTAALHGGWLRLDAPTVRTDLSLLKSVDTSVPFGSLGSLGLGGTLLADIQGQATVTRTSAKGSDDHLRASLPLPKLAKDLDAALASGLPAGWESDDSAPVPDQMETADITTHDGLLSEIRIDIAADLIPAVRNTLHGQPLALDIVFSAEPVTVVAPSSATSVDPTQLLKTFVDQAKAAEQEYKDFASDPIPTDVPCPSELTPSEAQTLCKDGTLALPDK